MRAPDREHLLLTVRQRASNLLPALRETRELLEDAVHVDGDFPPVGPQVAAHLEVFGDRHVRENVAAFRTMRDAERENFPRRRVGDVLPVENDFPAHHRDQAGNRSQRGSLAGAIGADQGRIRTSAKSGHDKSDIARFPVMQRRPAG